MVNVNGEDSPEETQGGFQLPDLDPIDELPLPNVSSAEDNPVDEADDDFVGGATGSLPDLTNDDQPDDNESYLGGEEPEVVDDPLPTAPSADEPTEEDLSDEAALRAILRAKEGNGGELPSGFEMTDEPTLADIFDLDAVLELAIDFGASDVHISPNDYVAFTKLGEIVRQPEFGRVSGAMTESILQKILTNQLEANFVERLELDTSYVIHGGRYDQRRFRLSVGKTFGDIFFVFRVISDSIPTPEDLGVTGALREWSTLPNGLVMMNGPTGTGKALALSTKIPTPEGFATMGELHVGSKVYDSKRNVVRVTGLSDIDESPELYRVTLSDGQTILADANHQWIVSTHDSREAVASRDCRALIAEGMAARLASRMLLSIEPDVEFCFEDQLFEHVTGAAHSFYPTVEAVARTLRFMDTPHELAFDGRKVYEVSRALSDLETRLRQRYEYDLDSPLRVLTTGEILESGFGVTDFAIPSVSSEADWIYIRSIERVESGEADYGAVRCISVDSEDHSYLCADHVVTHNSTTMASLLNAAIQERAQKIITIERPIEYLFPSDGRGFVTQREVGQDSREFATALDSAMRQAPDVIMIGESRNREEIDQVLRAAETGHLAFTTMHTNSAAATINRIKSLFEGNEQQRVLSTLSDVARGFANQVLLKSIDGKSRFAIRELLEFTEEVQAMVMEGDVKAIRRYQVENHITMEDGLVKAVVDGRCTPEVARAQSAYPLMFDKMLKSMG